MPSAVPALSEAFFKPFRLGSMRLANRIVMAPMTRMFAKGGVPGPDIVRYYERRAEGGVGLIVTEGTYIDHKAANGEPNIPAFHGSNSLAGWKSVVDAVHRAGGRIVPQIWHYGLMRRPGVEPDPSVPGYGPMAIEAGGRIVVEAMTQRDIDDVVASFARAAANAERIGFDGVALHGAHEYLIDSFLWEVTNQRNDAYGGTLEKRTRLAVEIVRAVRAAISPGLPLIFRFSQWKQRDYSARLATTPDELGRILRPISEAGVDIFDVSTRRFWEPAFAESDDTLAAWTKRLTGKPVITVGSVGVAKAFTVQDEGEATAAAYSSLPALEAGFERGDFDLVGVGRALLSEPEWPNKMRDGRVGEIRGYDRSAHRALVM